MDELTTTDEPTTDEPTTAEVGAELARLQAQAFANPATATTIIIKPDLEALAKLGTVTRCDACGYTVEPEDGHICTRKGGRLVECHPFACAVKDCLAARRGSLLPTLGHHAAHVQWHIDRWEKEDEAASAAALAVRVAAGPAAVPTADRWAAGAQDVPAGGGALVVLEAPHPGAVCVALLFSSSNLPHLVGECWRVGQTPLSAYVSVAAPLLAVVPVDGMEPGVAGDVVVINDGGADAQVRIGARWELRTDG